ncbi:predicted protein [Micromonas commoda]|uniref:Fe2OG dioxygenase domain-containing protein n=1 Tax=Micromonas commoda (strain RCC299 / NOUM17 / CCMP2709) TaxID=296587 RepID=C1E159_MICCC|nr:predicted protein [Micromonas commoda]ACO61682.1 predicted protein [Micromonas commoda]|eukprot:XP_002500424.1 predicted protein [Micromonas commoda]
MRRLHVQRLLLCCALLLLPNARALWFSMPPECDGRCWEEDVKHPLASCDLEVVEGAITPEEADDVVAAAEAHAAVHGWHSQRHIAYPTRDLPWTALPSVARVFDKLWGAMEESVRRRCGVRPIDRLTPNDIFVVKYTPEGQAGLDRHRDASSFSFNAALSDPTSYGGGGTRVWLDSAVRTLREKYLRAELEGVVRDGTAPGASAEARGAAARAEATLDRPPGTLDVDGYVVRPDRLLPEDGETRKIAKGSVMVHGGRNVHEGTAIVSGTRHIVAGFVGLNRHCCTLRYSGWRGVMALVRVTAMNNSARGGVRDKVGGRVPLWDYVLYEEWRGVFRWIRGASLVLALLSLAAYAAWHVATRLSPRFNLAARRALAVVAGYESSFFRGLARKRRRAMRSALPTKHSLDD